MNAIQKTLLIVLLANTITGLATINSNKFVPYISQITNHTDKDLYLELTYPKPTKTIILKPGKTIKNISLPLYKTEEDESGQWSIQNQEKEELATFDYGVTFRGPRFFRDKITVSFLRPGDVSFLEWEQSLDFSQQKKVSVGIRIDLKGEDLSETEIDARAVAQ